ncbi:cytochrome b [Pseudaminobacter arsenicus]|uniref:Cytochrome b n=1 Tax=Borborobacter arsenicus TaxID=1851146 RepID=A0A432V849_9HYPH|nr:cytochrome b [Pseudaminobacter arsenicus]RUM98233.1 cytochrome b [Pseudaminobacter arsenicus]
MNGKVRYDPVAVWLHWLVAVLVLAQFATGWIWGWFERGSEPRFYLFRTHIFIGSTILALGLLRVGWRLGHTPPPLPADMSRLQALAAHATHRLLYLAILLQPVLGLLTISTFGKSLGRWPRDLHNLGAKLIVAIVALHVAAALWHQLIRKDGLLARMIPARP